MIKKFINTCISRCESGVVNMTEKKCGGKEVIMEFALGAIAVVLAVVFRDELQGVIETVGATFSGKITSLFGSF